MFFISYIIKKIQPFLFRKFIFLFVVFFTTSSDCMESGSYEKEIIEIKKISQKIDAMTKDEGFDEYFSDLSNNPLVTHIKDHISIISREKVIDNYGKRRAMILFTLFAGTISSIGSLAFFVGEDFPKDFQNFTNSNIFGECSNFTNYTISNNVTEWNEQNNTNCITSTEYSISQWLAWNSVAASAIFYTWSMNGMLSLHLAQNPTLFKSEKSNCFHRFLPNLRAWRSWLPALGEWGFASAATIPLILLSLKSTSISGNEGFKYVIVGSISLIAFLTNKFSLSLAHMQIKNAWKWLWSGKKNNSDLPPINILEEAKNALLASTISANTSINYITKKEVKNVVIDLKNIAKKNPLSEEITPDQRWVNLTNHLFKDIYFFPDEINKKAMILVPPIAIFTALGSVGLIGSIPSGLEKWHFSPAAQYSLATISGIPIMEICLSIGASVGLNLSRIGDGTYSVSEQLTNRIKRFSGYSFITLFSVGSFAAFGALTIESFSHIPALTWFLLPSSALGIDLIHIVCGIALWNELLIFIETQHNPNKALFVNHINFLKAFQEKIIVASAKEAADLLLSLDLTVQKEIMQFLPSLQNKEFGEWNRNLKRASNEAIISISPFTV